MCKVAQGIVDDSFGWRVSDVKLCGEPQAKASGSLFFWILFFGRAKKSIKEEHMEKIIERIFPDAYFLSHIRVLARLRGNDAMMQK